MLGPYTSLGGAGRGGRRQRGRCQCGGTRATLGGDREPEVAVLRTDVPPELAGRGIAPTSNAHGFAISLDTAEPCGGGRIEGRVEARRVPGGGRARGSADG